MLIEAVVGNIHTLTYGVGSSVESIRLVVLTGSDVKGDAFRLGAF